MTTKELAVALAIGALAGAAGSTMIGSTLAAPVASALDPLTGDGAALDAWLVSTEAFCSERAKAADAIARMRASQGLSAKEVAKGQWLIEHTSKSGSVSVVVQISDGGAADPAAPVAPSAKPSKATP